MNHYSQNKVADRLVSDQLRSELNKLSNHSLVKVKTRMEGITSGERCRCYWNANLCAQTFGGSPVYGWWISSAGSGVTELLGHACWLTPEGVLVNPTKCDYDEIVFLPSSEVLALNGKSVESLSDLYFLENGCNISVLEEMLGGFSCQYVDNFAESLDLYWGESSREVIPVEKIFLPRFFLHETVSRIWSGVKTRGLFSDDSLLKKVFSPCIETRPHYLKKSANKPGVSFGDMFAFSFRNHVSLMEHLVLTGTHPSSFNYSDYNLDDAEGVLRGESIFLTNPSISTGRSIHEIPPSALLLEQMNPRGNKKRIRKYHSIATKNNLAIEELILMNDPRYTPHPYLIHKSKGLVRI
jgi:hypothetical protein